MDQYCILGRIGEGAHGIVFKAKHIEVSWARGGLPGFPPWVPFISLCGVYLFPNPGLGPCAGLPVSLLSPCVLITLTPLRGAGGGVQTVASCIPQGSPRSALWMLLNCLISLQDGMGALFHLTRASGLCVPPRGRVSRPLANLSQGERGGSVCVPSCTDWRDRCPQEGGPAAAGGRHPQPGPAGDQGPAGDRGQSVCE